MIGTNVIQFAQARQRRQNRDMAILAPSNDSWLSRYPEGIDGLVEGQVHEAEILRFNRGPEVN